MGVNMVTVIVEFRAKAGQAEVLAGALAKAIDNTISKPGCYEAELLISEDDPHDIAIYEQWSTIEAHKEYVAGIMADPKMEPVMGLMEAPPNSRYFAHRASGGGDWGGPGHLEICSDDVAATKAFLTDVFSWRFSEAMPGYDMFWAPGALFGGIRPKMDEEPAPQTIPYLVVDDLDARLERVQAAGGTITVPIQEVPQAGRFFWFLTPGGLPLAAWESFAKEG